MHTSRFDFLRASFSDEYEYLRQIFTQGDHASIHAAKLKHDLSKESSRKRSQELTKRVALVRIELSEGSIIEYKRWRKERQSHPMMIGIIGEKADEVTCFATKCLSF